MFKLEDWGDHEWGRVFIRSREILWLAGCKKRRIRGSGSSSSNSDVSSPESKTICNFTTSDSISSKTSTDKLPTTQNMEKIITQLQEILNRLDSVETKLRKLGLFERLENVETVVSKNRVDLNNVNEKLKRSRIMLKKLKRE